MKVISTLALLLLLSACSGTPTTGPRATVQMRDGSRMSGMVLRSNTIRHNLLDKQLRSDTLSPGQFTRGFLYFRLPKVDATSARLSLR